MKMSDKEKLIKHGPPVAITSIGVIFMFFVTYPIHLLFFILLGLRGYYEKINNIS